MISKQIIGLFLIAALYIAVILNAVILHGDFGNAARDGLRAFWGL